MPSDKDNTEPKIDMGKEVETKPIIQTEEESQLEYTENETKQFFDEDDEIIEVNWD